MLISKRKIVIFILSHRFYHFSRKTSWGKTQKIQTKTGEKLETRTAANEKQPNKVVQQEALQLRKEQEEKTKTGSLGLQLTHAYTSKSCLLPNAPTVQKAEETEVEEK